MPKVRCPECSSTNTVRIVYDIDEKKSKYEEDIKNGKVFWGGEAGCIIPRDDPNRHCNNCEFEFDTYAHKQNKISYLQLFE
jgi:hypothetical protein